MINKSNLSKLCNLLFLHIVLAFFSMSGIFSKLASKEKMFSIKFFILYSGVILVLGVYAFLWQKILKKMPLTIAFCNKAVTIVWGIIWGILFFKETVSLISIIGAAIVLLGVVLVVSEHE